MDVILILIFVLILCNIDRISSWFHPPPKYPPPDVNSGLNVTQEPPAPIQHDLGHRLPTSNPHPYWSNHNMLYPGGSPQSVEWQEIKKVVRARDGMRCVCCGSTELLHVDHIVPLSKGGSSEFHNLQTLCKSCHEKKTGRPLRDWRENSSGTPGQTMKHPSRLRSRSLKGKKWWGHARNSR